MVVILPSNDDFVIFYQFSQVFINACRIVLLAIFYPSMKDEILHSYNCTEHDNSISIIHTWVDPYFSVYGYKITSA